MNFDNITMRLAWMLPRRLAYWCAVRVGSQATVLGPVDQIAPELTMLESLRRWDVGVPRPVVESTDEAIRLCESERADEREKCARIAEQGCLVPPDGGSPTEAEEAMCLDIAKAIRARGNVFLRG